MKEENPIRESAAKVAAGIKAGDTSVNKMKIDTAAAQRIYRLMRNDKYEGALAFYVCEKLCGEVLGKIKDGLMMMDITGKEFPATKELIDLYITEKDKDVIFCALQGALIQSNDRVGMKCLEIIFTLYAKDSISP